MPCIEVAATERPFGTRLISGFSYPQRGAEFAICAVPVLVHYLARLSSYVGVIGSAPAWPATDLRLKRRLTHSALSSVRAEHPVRSEIEPQRQRLAALA